VGNIAKIDKYTHKSSAIVQEITRFARASDDSENGGINPDNWPWLKAFILFGVH
jgi:hypothetical protein